MARDSTQVLSLESKNKYYSASCSNLRQSPFVLAHNYLRLDTLTLVARSHISLYSIDKQDKIVRKYTDHRLRINYSHSVLMR